MGAGWWADWEGWGVKETGIIFKGQLVRKILAGEKTQTRRLIKPQPDASDGWVRWESPRYDNGDGVKYFHTDDASAKRLLLTACTYGIVGDRLWVRETWYDDCALRSQEPPRSMPDKYMHFRADGEAREQFE